jgi:hypothetical protein
MLPSAIDTKPKQLIDLEVEMEVQVSWSEAEKKSAVGPQG